MINKLRSFLFKLLFGADFKSFIIGNIETYAESQKLRYEVKEVQNQVASLHEAVMELIEMSGGAGWTNTIQNAIGHLDVKVQVLQNTIIEQSEAVQQMFENSIPVDQLVDLDDITYDN